MDKFLNRKKDCSPQPSSSNSNLARDTEEEPNPLLSSPISSSSEVAIDRPKKKRKLYFVKYKPDWSKNFKWVENRNGKAYCRFCMKALAGGKHHLERHSNSILHKQNAAVIHQSKPINVALEDIPSKKLEREVKIAELKLLILAAEHNLPFLIFEHLPQFIQSLPDPGTMKLVKCSRTKATNLINNKVGPFVQSSLASILKETFFSIILDETTDITTAKCLVIITRYYCTKKEQTIDALFSLLEINVTTANAIFNAVINTFSKYDIPITNIIGFASDNASVMMGELNGVKAKLQNINPNIFVIGCLAHSLHLCASKACAALPNEVENFARNIFNYFSHSAKRQHSFKEFQQFVDAEPHKLLKPSQTRWLSLNNVVNRIMEQWNALILFFQCEVLVDNVYGAQEILNLLNNVTNKLYFKFLQFILNIVIKMNVDFQSEHPKIHTILPTVTMYYKMILKFYMKNDVFETTTIENINPKDNSYFHSLENIYLGTGFEVIITENATKLTTDELNIIKSNCLNFYSTLCYEIRSRIQLNDEKLIEISKILDLSNIFSNNKTPILKLALMFPNIIKTKEEIEALSLEWRLISEYKTGESFSNIQQFISFLNKQRNQINEQPFITLIKFFTTLISLPHGSASAERVFSVLSIVKNKHRNNLNVSTVENLLLADEWTPSEELINFEIRKDE